MQRPWTFRVFINALRGIAEETSVVFWMNIRKYDWQGKSTYNNKVDLSFPLTDKVIVACQNKVSCTQFHCVNLRNINDEHRSQRSNKTFLFDEWENAMILSAPKARANCKAKCLTSCQLEIERGGSKGRCVPQATYTNDTNNFARSRKSH